MSNANHNDNLVAGQLLFCIIYLPPMFLTYTRVYYIPSLILSLFVVDASYICAAAALRGVAIQRGRARAAFPTTHAAAAALNGAFARLPTPMAAAANAANAMHGYAP